MSVQALQTEGILDKDIVCLVEWTHAQEQHLAVNLHRLPKTHMSTKPSANASSDFPTRSSTSLESTNASSSSMCVQAF